MKSCFNGWVAFIAPSDPLDLNVYQVYHYRSCFSVTFASLNVDQGGGHLALQTKR